MSANLAAILDAVETQILTLEELSPDRVIQGRMIPKSHDHTVNIVPTNDTGKWEDGSDVQRTLTFMVAVVVRIDESKAAAQFKQLNALYALVHAKLEEFVASCANGTALTFQEDSGPGVEWDGFEDAKDQVAFAVSRWQAIYSRTLG